MGFHAVQLNPDFVGYGSSGGPGHKTFIPETDSGVETRKSLYTQARRRWEIRQEIDHSLVQELFEFILERRGAAHSFLFQDLLDYTTASDDVSAPAWNDQQIGTGDGTQTEFELKKDYTSGPITQTRRIVKPVGGSVVAGTTSELTLGTDFTVDHQIGRVSFVTAPAAAQAVYAGCSFYVPVRFGKSADDLLGLSYDGFRGASYSLDLVEEVFTDRHVAFTELTPHGGSIVYDAPVHSPEYIQFHSGRYHERKPSSVSIIRLPDVHTVAGSGSMFSDNVVSAGGPYFAIANVGTANIFLQEYRGGWRPLHGYQDVVKPGTIREVFLCSDGLWRAR